MKPQHSTMASTMSTFILVVGDPPMTASPWRVQATLFTKLSLTACRMVDTEKAPYSYSPAVMARCLATSATLTAIRTAYIQSRFPLWTIRASTLTTQNPVQPISWSPTARAVERTLSVYSLSFFTSLTLLQVTTDVGENACSSSHGGTSAAAPNAAGVFALALQVRSVSSLVIALV